MIFRIKMILSVVFYGRKINIFYEKKIKLAKIILLIMFFVIEFFLIITFM